MVQLSGQWSETATQSTGYSYIVRNQSGATSTVHVPWSAKEGDRVRIRQHRSRMLGLMLAAEAPELCPTDGTCD